MIRRSARGGGKKAVERAVARAATVPTEGRLTVDDDERLTRDGLRSSRYVSAAAGGMMMRPADLEVARQQREEDHAWWAQVSNSRSREVEIEAAAILAEAAESQQSEFEAELRATEEFAECRSAKAVEAASVSAEYNFDEATVAPLLMWLTSHSAAWAMGRMATVVVRAARTSSSKLQSEPIGQGSTPTKGKLQCSENSRYAASGTAVQREEPLCGERHSGAEPLTEALAQALARDGPRSSRHTPEAPVAEVP